MELIFLQYISHTHAHQLTVGHKRIQYHELNLRTSIIY